MRDTDKTPTQCAVVQGKDSPCAVRERARIRTEVQKTHDEWMQGYNDDSTPFTAGWITALRHVMYTIIDAGGEPHE